MTTEEKAKAYDEALDIARELYEKDNVFDSEKTLIRCIFPELAESEDERIKKAISQCVEDMRGQFEKLYGVHHKDAIAWLEKQGEPKQEWSEEDENRFQNIIACIEDCYNEKDAQDLIRWFKSLRHQPKQVWSKADIKMLELIIDGYQNTEDFSKVDGVFVDWLKSLKDRMEGKELEEL